MSPAPAYVLAGGRSTRMGRDKAWLPVGGVPMAVRVADVFVRAGHPVTLVRRAPSERWTLPDGAPLRVLHEPDEHAPHPLIGVLSALRDARSDCLIAPCDLPFLTSGAVGALVASGPGSVAFDGERVHPLLAFAPSAWLRPARVLSAQGAPVRRLVREARRVRLGRRVLRNVNRREDLDG